MTGRVVLAWILGGFATVIAVNATLVVFALDSHPGTVSDTPWQDGLRYNAVIDRDRAQAERGWRASLAYDAAREAIVLRVDDRDGRPVSSLAGRLRLSRPGGAARTLDLAAVGLGRYEVRVALDKPGRWLVGVEAADAAGAAFRMESELWRR